MPLAQLPPMGWNSWNTFGWKINEQLIFEMADLMASQGYREAGYEYLVIDDCWSLRERGADGRIVPDPEKFPSACPRYSDIHEKFVCVFAGNVLHGAAGCAKIYADTYTDV